MNITELDLKSVKDCLELDKLEERLLKLEKEIAKPRLEDLWNIEFVELEEGFAPKSNCATDAGHDLKVCPTEINIEAIECVKTYLEASETDYINHMQRLYVDGKYQDWSSMFIEDRVNVLNKLFAKVNKEPVVFLQSRAGKEKGNSKLVGCGFKVALPDLSVIPGWTSVMLATPRSGLGINCKIQLGNTIGVIDQTFRGEVKVDLTNNSLDTHIFTKGARVAQALIMPCMSLASQNTRIVSNLDETERGEKGFGHSGV